MLFYACVWMLRRVYGAANCLVFLLALGALIFLQMFLFTLRKGIW
jgi:hypothetical protein